MVVIKNKPKQQQQLLLDADQQETTTPTQHFQKSREEPPPAAVVPQRFERVLTNLTVDLDYPGYAVDVSATRAAIVSSDSKSKMLRLFRQMKEKQRVYDEYSNRNKNVSSSKKEMETVELVQRRPERSDQKEKRDVSEDYDKYDNTTKKEEVRDNIEEDPRDDKEDNIYAEEDRRSPSNFVHSWKVQQDRRHVMGDHRSQWRVQKLDDLRVDYLTYPEWEIDLAHVEDWHRRHHSDTRENTIRFHEIMEGMLHQQYLYLSWKDDYDHDHDQEQEQEPQRPQNPFPDVDQIAIPIVHYNRGSSDSDSDSDDTQEVVEEMQQPSLDNKSEKKKTEKSNVADRKNKSKISSEQKRSQSKKYSLDSHSKSYMTVGALCAAHRRRLVSSNSSSMNEERRESSETEKKKQYRRSLTSPKVTEEELGHCDMCTIRVNTHVFVPCGHLGCAACSHHAWRTRARCPTCQQTVNNVVRLESSSVKLVAAVPTKVK